MSELKISFIFVHGAWHRGAHFDLVTKPLRELGYGAVAVDLPSVTSDPAKAPPNADADTACVRSAIISELDHGRDVIVVCHSYGGIPTTSALRDLDTASRHAAGQTTSVITMAPIACFIVPEGMNVTQDRGSDVSGGYHRMEGPFLHLLPEKIKPSFAADVPDSTLEKFNYLFGPQTIAALADISKYTAYTKVPVYYLFCDDDVAFPVDQQQMMVDRIAKDGCGITVEHIKASHSPFLSMPEKVVDFLRRAAGEHVPQN